MTELELNNLLSDMTLEEKIDQLIQLHGGFYGDVEQITGPGYDFNLKPDQQWHIGSILGELGAEHLKTLQDGFMQKQPHHIPAIFMADVIHGCRTIFPVPIAQGASFDPTLVYDMARASAKESAAMGLHATFSPMADLCRDSRWGRCMESTGEDPWLNSRMSEAMVKGYQGDGLDKSDTVAACVKHFAGYGAATAGRDYSGAELCERTLFDDYLLAYEACIKVGVPLVMTAFNTIDRIPCTTNRRLMRDILREKLGFDGVLISDYGAIGETVAHTSSADKCEAAKKAMVAGVDIDMMSDCYMANLEELVRSDELDESLIDEACLRVLKLKNDLGLFENPYKGASPEKEREILYCDEHKNLCIRAARQSCVLLENNGILPLSQDKKIVVVGSLADRRDITGSWAIFAEKDKTVTFADALKERFPDADISVYPYDEPDDEMLGACKNADCVIACLGEDESRTGESKSVVSIDVSSQHYQLFDAVNTVNDNIVCLFYGARPVTLGHFAALGSAILFAWYPGTYGNLGVADILFGRANPCGKLPMSFPHRTGQLPMSYSAFTTGRPVKNSDHYIPFASNYMDCPNEPLYPFGYGLSYSKFEYGKPILSSDTLAFDGKITATVTLTNTSDCDGMAVTQLYIKDVKGSVVRPDRELKGIDKQLIKAGESRDISFDITSDMLRFYDVDMNYTAEKGEFVVYIGDSSKTENSAEFKLA